MTLNDDVCDLCGCYVDPMNDEAVARVVRGVWCLWCSEEHAVEWLGDLGTRPARDAHR